MVRLMSYDDWKTHNPDDDRCEFCGVAPWQCRGGWQPDQCTGECRQNWRDPDAEYEAKRDDADFFASVEDEHV
jgi:hypothetical protein